MRPSFRRYLLVYDSSRLVGIGDLQNEPGEDAVLCYLALSSTLARWR